MKRFSRILSWLLCMAMVVAMVPAVAFAAEEITPAGVMNFNEFSLTTQGNAVVTIEDAGSTVRGNLSSGSTNEMVMTTTDARIDHDKDMILTQSIDPTDLSVWGNPCFVDYNGWYDGTNSMRNAYNFWMSDTAHASEGAAVVFSLGKLDGSNMILRVHQNGSKVHTDVTLKAYSADPFDLTIRWNADDSVEIYVDGVSKGTVENATINTTALFGDDTVGIRYFTHNANGAPGKFAVSNMSLKTVDSNTMNFNEFSLTTQGNAVVTIEDAGSTVRGNLSSGSTNEMVMTTTDARIDHDKDMILTQSIDPTDLSVWGNPCFVDYNGWYDGTNSMRNAYNFWMSDTAHASEGAAVVFSLGKLDGSNMILRVHQNGSKVHTDVTLKAYSADPFDLTIRWNADDSVEIYVDGVSKGTVENATINTTALFGDDTVGIRYFTHNANGAPGKFAVSGMLLTVMADVEPEEPNQPEVPVESDDKNFNDFTLTAQGAPVVTVDEDGKSVSASISVGSTGEMMMTTTDTRIDHSKDMVLTQTIDPINLSVAGTPRFVDYTEWMGSNVMRNGYNFWIGDTAHASEGAAVVFSVGKLYVPGNENGANMMLRVHQNGNNVNTDIKLKAYSTDSFALAVRWNADDSVDIYVDGEFKATVANATVNTATLFGDNTLGIRYHTHNANGAPGVFAVSDMSLKIMDSSAVDFNNFALSAQGVPTVTVKDAGNTVAGEILSGSIGEMKMTTTDTRIDHSKDMILTQTINPINLSAAGNPLFVDYTAWNAASNDMRNAYQFWMSDSAHDSEGAAVVFSVGQLYNSGANKNGGSMLLRVHQNGSKVHTDITLKEYNTDPFELAVRWNTNGSVEVYVDGVLKGTVENATVNTTTLFGDNTLGIRYYTNNAGGVKPQFAVSDMTLAAVEPIVITGANLQLNSILSVKFYAPAGNTVKVSVPGTADQELTSADGVYVAKVFAQDMTKDITATLFDAAGIQRDSKTFRLATYVGQLTGKDATLAQATLTYCQYAAMYKGNFNGTPNALEAIPANAFDSITDYPTSGPSGSSISAYLEDACQIRLYLPSLNYTVKVDGKAADIQQVGSYNICSTELILPQNYDKDYTFTVLTDGEGAPVDVTLSVLSYLDKCLNGGISLHENQRNLMTAMYHYYAAAEAYLAG